MKQRKIPLRKCVVCNERKDKIDLIRIVKNKEGEVAVDSSGKLNGRGAYICKSIDCFNIAKKNKRINYALKAEIPEEVFKRLLEEINKDE